MVETFSKTMGPALVWRTMFYIRAKAGQGIARYFRSF